MTDSDEKYMQRALQLAALGRGHTSPNPMVGAVIVCEGKIIGEGYHRCFGGPHAEVNAVASVNDTQLLHQSTIYVTLEPCSHYGKTPPCAQMLIEHVFKRVVIGTSDPFKEVGGRGIQMLRDAGIEVKVGVLEKECKAINERFITAHTRGVPWVMLKWAQSADGFIAATTRRATFSTPLSLLLMHKERAAVDAIVVGAGTVIADDPSLTVRLWNGHQPIRVVLDKRLEALSKGGKMFCDGGKTLVFNEMTDDVRGNVELIRVDMSSSLNWLKLLYQRGLISVMVEGGAKVLSTIIAENHWDEARVETSPEILHEGLPAPPMEMPCVNEQKTGKNIIRWFRNEKEFGNNR